MPVKLGFIILSLIGVLRIPEEFYLYKDKGHARQSSDQNFSSQGYDRQSSEQNNRKLISLHNNGEDDKHAHGFADF